MEEVILTLREIQKELAEQKRLINKRGEEMTEKITLNINKILDEKLKIIEENYKNLESKVENQEQRLYYLEKQSRQRNLVFFGLEELENSYKNMENYIIDFIHKHLTTEIDRKDLQAIRRVGKKNDRPRPVVITFATLGQKIHILKCKGALNETPYYIKEDYPKEVLQIRRSLQDQVQAEKKKGNIAIIKYDKLVLLKNTHTNNNNQKRNLPNSPENNTNNITEQRPQTNKKSKTILTETVPRSASFSEGVVKPGMLKFLQNKNNNNKQNTDT